MVSVEVGTGITYLMLTMGLRFLVFYQQECSSRTERMSMVQTWVLHRSHVSNPIVSLVSLHKKVAMVCYLAVLEFRCHSMWACKVMA